jgi:hypothetical protein
LTVTQLKADKKVVTWTLNIADAYSNQPDNVLPDGTIEANSADELGRESMKSVKYGLSILPGSWPGYSVLQIKGTMHLPAIGKNKIASDLEFTGKLELQMGSPNQPSNKVRYMRLSHISLRMTAVDHPGLSGPFGKAFVSGANYILSFLDEVDLAGVVAPDLVGLARN